MNIERVLKVAVVGCGNMGYKHAINCSQMEGVSVVAVVDLDLDRARPLGAKIRSAVYDNVDEMLADVPVDAVIIATPPGLHHETVKAAADVGKALFVEKPISLNLSDARICCSAVNGKAIVNAAGFQLRYSPLTLKAKNLILGRQVTHVRTACTTSYYINMDMPPWFLQRKHSGGPLLEQSIHVIDMARYLVDDITHVFARGDRLVFPNLAEFDSEDTLVLAYRFANGALGTHIDSCAMTEFNWEVELFGSSCRLLVDYARNRLSGHIDGEMIEKKFSDENLHMLEMQVFLAAVHRPSNNGILSDLVDATKTLAVVLAGDRSLKTGVWEPVVG